MFAFVFHFQPVKEEEDLDGLALDDVDGVPLDELDGMPLDGELDGEKPKLGEELVKGIVPYGDDLDGEPGYYCCCHMFVAVFKCLRDESRVV